MNFEVQLSRKAVKQLKNLDKKVRASVAEALVEIEEDPFTGDYQKLKAGDGHRRRIGKYRILFEIDTDLRLVTVYGIPHRREAYR